MKKASLIILIVFVSLTGIAADSQSGSDRSSAGLQSFPCIGPNGHSTNEIHRLRFLAAASDFVAIFSELGFVPVSAAEITLVSDPAVCHAATQARNALIDTLIPIRTPAESLYVIRAGPRYDIFDPSEKEGDLVVHRVFDTTFTHVRTHFR